LLSLRAKRSNLAPTVASGRDDMITADLTGKTALVTGGASRDFE
jgi:hypothetical protein